MCGQITEDSVKADSQTDETTIDKVSITKEEYEVLKNAKADADKKLLYAYADFENFKKRKNKDLEESIKFANEKLIKDVLPVIDNLHLAMEHAKATAKDGGEQINKFLEGVDMISSQLSDVLSKFGVECISVNGKSFDPNYHEALDQQESEEHENGQIVKEYQKGYLFNGRVLRCSKVSVAKKK